MPKHVWRGLIAVVAAGFAIAALAQDGLRITAPSAPGSGWDHLGRAIGQALADSGAVQSIHVVNVPGAGGTVGLAEFIANAHGDGTQLLVTGLAMVSATLINKPPVGLDQVTPIARLTGEYLVIVVPADSPFKSIHDLAAAVQADAAKVTWAGGPTGSIDHIAVALFATAVHADPTKIGYVPFLSSAEAITAVVDGKVAVGVAASGDVGEQARAEKLRMLAVTGPKRLDGVDAPTLVEAGFALEFGNWRGVVAPSGLTQEQRLALGQTVQSIRQSPVWIEAIQQKGWEDAYLAGEAFEVFIKEEQARLAAVLKSLGLLK